MSLLTTTLNTASAAEDSASKVDKLKQQLTEHTKQNKQLEQDNVALETTINNKRDRLSKKESSLTKKDKKIKMLQEKIKQMSADNNTMHSDT